MSSTLENAVVSETAPIEEALRRIDANKLGVVFALDAAGRVAGIVTDGDARRQLLARNDMGSRA